MTVLTPSRSRNVILSRGGAIPSPGTLGAARELLKEAQAAPTATFHIFLCHSSRDADDVRRVKTFLEAFGYVVYVDWIEDGNLDRALVDPIRADLLRTRIKNSIALLVYCTINAKHSRWTPWELGYADGLGKRVGLLPEVPDGTPPGLFPGVEYFGLYPYVDLAPVKGTAGEALWVNRSDSEYIQFQHWLDGKEPHTWP